MISRWPKWPPSRPNRMRTAGWANPPPNSHSPTPKDIPSPWRPLKGKICAGGFLGQLVRTLPGREPERGQGLRRIQGKEFCDPRRFPGQGDKDAWQEAIHADNLAWTQVSDLKFWSSKAVDIFKFDGIPFNVLIDPQGTVIAQSLRGDDLENKLKEVLGNSR